MKPRDYLIVVLAPVPVLLIPLVAMQVSTEWNWNVASFVVAWVVIAGATLIYRLLATRPASTFTYRLAAGIAVAGGFLLTWVNLAVGLIGSEDNPLNALYFGVVLLGLVGVGFSRLEAGRLARVAFAMAGAIFLVPVIAFAIRRPDFSPGVAKVFGLNACFVLLFVASGLLFRHAARGVSRAAASDGISR